MRTAAEEYLDAGYMGDMGDLASDLSALATGAQALLNPVTTIVSSLAGTGASAVTQDATGDPNATGTQQTVDNSTSAVLTQPSTPAVGSCPPTPGQSSLSSPQSSILAWEAMLRTLGYYSGPDDPTGMSVAVRTATCQFQSAQGLTPDGLLGPNTGARLQALTNQPPPSPSTPPAPGGNPDITPASDTTTDSSGPNWLLIGGGAVALLLVGALLLTGKKKRKK